ncbi:PH domain-containing protein [Methanolobus profundi]|uniref:PH domain-containing protein n=1 Tax=Methanolobus profundi TaxID=487685 RepID=A0A1I4R8K2_9EURY|nr:PH domain-containing protein [Methanolobus profundi]SFM48549.1 PH domain-containing protein [Methanolobus profundi]
MRYIKDNLKPGEWVVFETEMHWAVIIYAIILGIPLYYVHWALYFVPSLYLLPLYGSTEVSVTNQRIVMKHGFLTTNIDEIFLDKINNITLKQGLPGIMLGYGSVHVHTASMFGKKYFLFMKDPAKLKDVVSEQAANCRQKETSKWQI